MSSHRQFRWHKRYDGQARDVWRRPAGTAHTLPEVTIRPARADDTLAIRRLAVLDSADVPPGALLLAEVSGELWAAVTVAGGPAVADPFRPTAELVRLLRLRAEQLCEADHRSAGTKGLTRLAPWSRASAKTG